MLPTDGIYYKGGSLPCTGIDKWDSGTVAIQKLEETLCEKIQTLAQLYSEIDKIKPFITTTTSTTTL